MTIVILNSVRRVFIVSSGFVTTLGAVKLFLPDLLPAISRESALTTEGASQRLRYLLNLEPQKPMSELLTLSQLGDPTKSLNSDQVNQLADLLEKRNDLEKKADALKYQELLKINKELTEALEEKNKSSS